MSLDQWHWDAFRYSGASKTLRSMAEVIWPSNSNGKTQSGLFQHPMAHAYGFSANYSSTSSTTNSITAVMDVKNYNDPADWRVRAVGGGSTKYSSAVSKGTGDYSISFTVTGLSAGTSYTLQLQLRSKHTNNNWVNEGTSGSETTESATLPSEVTNVLVSPGPFGSGYCDITWSHDGSADNFEFIWTSNNYTNTLSGGSRSHRVFKAEEFKIKACNAAGCTTGVTGNSIIF